MPYESVSPPDALVVHSWQLRQDSARSSEEAYLLLSHLDTLFTSLHQQLHRLTRLEGAARRLATAPVDPDPVTPAGGHAPEP